MLNEEEIKIEQEKMTSIDKPGEENENIVETHKEEQVKQNVNIECEIADTKNSSAQEEIENKNKNELCENECQITPSIDNLSSEGSSASHVFDPYSYLKREEFTTEIYKIEINNLPKRLGYSQVKKKLITLKLKPSKVKLIDCGDFAYVNFRSEADRMQALAVLDNYSWKGKQLQVKKASPAADPLLKRKLETASSGKEVKRKKCEDDDSLPVAERLNNVVTPLWKCPYEEQLKKKHDDMVLYTKTLSKEIEKNNTDSRWRSSNISPLLQEVSPSPKIFGYRNKCEFTIGPGFDTDKVAGFRLGSYISGEVRVIEPTECMHVSPCTKKIIKTIGNYLQMHSEYSAFDPVEKQGNWMQVTVRESRKNQAMAILHFNPQNLDQDAITAEKMKLKQYFVDGEGKEANITSLFFQLRTDRLAETNTQEEHLHGDKHICESLLGLQFRVSPNAFFQVNTEAAEVLYKTIGEFCTLKKEKTVLLDICCGTGTIGLTMAKDVKRVVGIEMCEEAIEDAKVNMEMNGIKNAEFKCGKAEDILPSVLRREIWNLGDAEIIAVVDPPRAGLHSDVIKAIRKNGDIKQLIYVSCHPKSAKQNIVDLARSQSNRIKGPPFIPTKIKPLDLFPHTDHCEMVMVLER